MPLKPDGKAARVERVAFTKNSAERIGRVVRIVEAGDRDARPMLFAPRLEGGTGRKTFRVCTFTGAWSIGSTKTVTYKNQTTTPNTASVTNLFWPIPEGGTRDCAIAKDGTAWYLLVPQLYSVNAATGATLTSSALEFKAVPVVSLATAGTAAFSVSVTTCSTAAS